MHRIVRLGTAVVVAALVLTSASAASAQSDESQATLTAIAVRPLTATEPVRGADGLVHLVYELEVTNLSAKVVTVQSIDVLDPGDDDTIVAEIAADALAPAMRIDGFDTRSTSIPPGGGAVIFLDVPLEAGAGVPVRLTHRFRTLLTDPDPTAGVRAADTAAETQEFIGAPQRVVRRPAVVLAPPLRGGGWVIGNGCCALTAHRAATLPIDGTIHVPERFAIDFVQVDDQGLLATGDPGANASYAFYGDDVFAVAPGTVVEIQDGLPDEVPGALPPDATIQTAGGNYVVVDLGRGRYAFYAHLIPDSLEVKVGDTVETGDVLGSLGNSGNSDGPHLHFHVMDGPSPLTSNGLPFVFTEFTTEGRVTNIEALQEGAPAAVDASVDAGRHRRELPLGSDVVEFSDAKDRSEP